MFLHYYFLTPMLLCIKMFVILFIVQDTVNKYEIYIIIAAYFIGREDNLFPKVLSLTSPDCCITEL